MSVHSSTIERMFERREVAPMKEATVADLYRVASALGVRADALLRSAEQIRRRDTDGVRESQQA